MTSSTLHIPDGNWKFDETVGECFDDMVERSIPNYNETIDLLTRLSLPHLGTGQATIVDLGCSNGNALHRIRDLYIAERPTGATRIFGVDMEQHMLDRAAVRLGSCVEFVQHDLRLQLPYRIASLKPNCVFLLWTAQFVPLEFRARLFREIREIIAPNGALFVAEKLRGQTSRFQSALAREYRNFKVRTGKYSTESVTAKERALEGVLVSLSAPEQKQLMAAEGWEVEEVTRYLGFASYYLLPK